MIGAEHNSSKKEDDQRPKSPGALGGLKIVGLKEETEKMHEENKGSPKMMNEISLKAPTRNSPRKCFIVLISNR